MNNGSYHFSLSSLDETLSLDYLIHENIFNEMVEGEVYLPQQICLNNIKNELSNSFHDILVYGSLCILNFFHASNS